MTCIQRTAPAPAHTCAPPMRPVTYTLDPSITFNHEPSTTHATVVDGDIGDLWRCDPCGKLWRIADACDACDWYGNRPHRGTCTLGLAWRPATLWQRLRHRRRR